MQLINIFQWILVIYSISVVLFLLGYAILGKIPYRPKHGTKNYLHKIALFIPGYKEDEVIVSVAKKALEINYPADKYDVIIIADSFLPETIEELKKLPIKVIEVSFEKSTKARALNKAMSQLPDTYDIALILDADNVLKPNFLHIINDSFNAGYQVVQGHRTAKNLNTPVAVLDAASEEINNTIYSLGHRVIGLSSRLVGSGMAFNYQLFKNTMATIDAIGGFDKELELKLLKQRIKIEYRHDAVCYDEKVHQSDSFAKQRMRWLSAQYYYFKHYFFDALKDLVTKGNIDYFDKAYQMMLPPRLLFPGFLFILFVINILWQPQHNITLFWGVLFAGNILSFFIAIPSWLYNKQLLAAFMKIPAAFIKIFLALFKLKEANKSYIHTPHTNFEPENHL
jgi:cellulose synthase/poly-beta-1,6-N-acetylglucosamine synthase-like glycosyltransferase